MYPSIFCIFSRDAQILNFHFRYSFQYCIFGIGRYRMDLILQIHIGNPISLLKFVKFCIILSFEEYIFWNYILFCHRYCYQYFQYIYIDPKSPITILQFQPRYSRYLTWYLYCASLICTSPFWTIRQHGSIGKQVSIPAAAIEPSVCIFVYILAVYICRDWLWTSKREIRTCFYQ